MPCLGSALSGAFRLMCKRAQIPVIRLMCKGAQLPVGVNGRHGIDIDWQFSDFVLSERCLSERPCRKAMKAPELAHDPRFPFMERGYAVRVQKYAKGCVSTKELLLTNGKDGDDIFY